MTVSTRAERAERAQQGHARETCIVLLYSSRPAAEELPERAACGISFAGLPASSCLTSHRSWCTHPNPFLVTNMVIHTYMDAPCHDVSIHMAFGLIGQQMKENSFRTCTGNTTASGQQHPLPSTILAVPSPFSSSWYSNMHRTLMLPSPHHPSQLASCTSSSHTTTHTTTHGHRTPMSTL